MNTHSKINKGEKTAERIREAGLTLFASRGYAATSMRDIAKACHIGAGAIYHHVASKQDLLVLILEEHMSGLLHAASVELIENKPEQALERFIRFHIHYHHDKSREVFLSYLELRNLEEKNLDRIIALRDQYETVLRQILDAGLKTRDFSFDDPQITTKAILGMLASIPKWYQDGGRLELDALTKVYWTLIAQMVGLRVLGR